jgi:hypothetical protein
MSNIMNGMIIPKTIPMFPGNTTLKMGQWMIICSDLINAKMYIMPPANTKFRKKVRTNVTLKRVSLLSEAN